MFEKFIVNFAIPEKRIFGVLIAAGIVLSFVLFILVTYNITSERFIFWDVAIIQSLQSYTFLTVPLVVVSSFGQLSVSILFFLLLVVFLYKRGYRREVVFVPAPQLLMYC